MYDTFDICSMVEKICMYEYGIYCNIVHLYSFFCPKIQKCAYVSDGTVE